MIMNIAFYKMKTKCPYSQYQINEKVWLLIDIVGLAYDVNGSVKGHDKFCHSGLSISMERG